MIRNRLLAALAMVCLTAHAASIEDAIAKLKAARAAGTEQAYLDAESILSGIIEREPSNANALYHRGAARFERAGWLVRKNEFAPAQSLMAEACSDFDRAVSLAPNALQTRLKRGLLYARFPAFYNKTEAARQDLEFAVAHPDFSKESAETQTAASKLLASLAKRADNPKPDRFPRVTAETSPVIVAASVTSTDYAGARGTDPPPLIQTILQKLRGQPGLLGMHTLSSFDRKGMIVILTWWRDKQAVNDWFYGDAHQGMIREVYGEGRRRIEGAGPTQVAIELFTTLPGGIGFNGGLAPDGVTK